MPCRPVVIRVEYPIHLQRNQEGRGIGWLSQSGEWMITKATHDVKGEMTSAECSDGARVDQDQRRVTSLDPVVHLEGAFTQCPYACDSLFIKQVKAAGHAQGSPVHSQIRCMKTDMKLTSQSSQLYIFD
jgi:hypothetical protein